MATQLTNASEDYLALHFGSCGCSLGDKFWELACSEHDLSFSTGESKRLFRRYQSLFSQNESGRYRARALFIDPDGQDISHLKTGPIRGVTDLDMNYLTEKQDALGNFAAGYYTNSNRINRELEIKLSRLIETCDKTPTFLSTVSYTGGSAGIYCRIMSRILNTEFSKATHINFGIFPSPFLGKSSVDSYNFVLSQYAENWDKSNFLRIVFDNEALYAASTRHANTVDLGFGHVNIEVARVMSLLTSSSRFNIESQTTADLTKMIVKPRLNYLIPSYTFLPGQESDAIEFDSTFPQLMEGGAMLASCPFKEVLADTVYTKGVTPSFSFQQKFEETMGNLNGSTFENIHIDPREIPVKMQAFKRFEFGRLTNNKGIRAILKREAKKFDKLFCMRAFVHWYVGYGMEEMEFVDARESLESVIQDLQGDNDSDSDSDSESETGDSTNQKVEESSQLLDEVEELDEH